MFFSLNSPSVLASLTLNMAKQSYVLSHHSVIIIVYEGIIDDRFVQGTSEEAAKDIAAFVAIFFEHFNSFKGRAFHMAGESYGVSNFTGQQSMLR